MYRCTVGEVTNQLIKRDTDRQTSIYFKYYYEITFRFVKLQTQTFKFRKLLNFFYLRFRIICIIFSIEISMNNTFVNLRVLFSCFKIQNIFFYNKKLIFYVKYENVLL